MPASKTPKHDPWADLLADPALAQAAVEAAQAEQARRAAERPQIPAGPAYGSRFD